MGVNVCTCEGRRGEPSNLKWLSPAIIRDDLIVISLVFVTLPLFFFLVTDLCHCAQKSNRHL